MTSNSTSKLKAIFAGRRLVIATMHKKERVMAPLLKKELGVICIVPNDFDTDALGTFAGEVERKQDAFTTAKNKCLKAMELTNCDLGIASEGSFGAHPSLFFVGADDELVFLIDEKNKLEIVGKEISTNTNFNGSEISSVNELIEFARKALFPSHRLIIKNTLTKATELSKGICDREELIDQYHYFMNKYGSVYVETDMRAMYNPTRMKVIKKATSNLIQQMHSFCPSCDFPGFSISFAIAGLPCKQCKLPTRSTLAHVYKCKKCNYINEIQFPYKRYGEEPTFCDFCNP